MKKKHCTEPDATMPKNYARVYDGNVFGGDILWDSVNGWECADLGEIGRPVNAFKAVARVHCGNN